MEATPVFWAALITGPLTKLITGCVIFGFLILNFFIALKAYPKFSYVDINRFNLPKETIILPGLITGAVIAFVLASGLTIDWTVIQQFIHQVNTGISDPIFNKDLGFYLFSLPFYNKINSLIQTTCFLGLAGTALIYFLAKAFWKSGKYWDASFPAKLHLVILTTIFLIAKIWGYLLAKFNLLFQETNRITGINYTAHNANLLALQILIGIIVIVIGILFFSLFRKNTAVILGSLAVWLVLSVILGAFYPEFIQSFVVRPNEYELEAPYLKNHIQFTRQAYGLDKIKLRPFNPDSDQINPPATTNPALKDLRLWDYGPLQFSYNQLQSIRPYYSFNDIDIDRYPTNNGQQQVMIAARELSPDKLSSNAKSWINMHLVYTHGYGFAANPVNQFSTQGQPVFIARDLPPKVTPGYYSLDIKRPEIYYGELTTDYVIVNTKTGEFDYPKGDQNIETSYQGKRGIPLNSYFNRLLMALKFQEANFLLSKELTSESNVLIYRNIIKRAKKLAPFLKFDTDPYLVVADEKLYWIIDAFTYSSSYPYAKYHHMGINYIRNSVKVVIDAYNGTVSFYIVDQDDPIIKVWQRVFPKMFQPLANLAPSLKAHLRYPESLMLIQRELLTQYHMTNPKTFYSQEDQWEIPIHNKNKVFEPYYVTLLLPDNDTSEFVLMQPFSPRNKQNLISWLIARCDQPHYGELILYTLPKDQNIYGPAQIDARINQNETISQLITLWDQNQSNVTWGNLLIVPLEDSILYVKPLFIESEQSQLAELKKIILVYNDQVLIGDTVNQALNNLVVTTKQQLDTTTRPDESETNHQATRKTIIIKRINELTEELNQLLKELQRL